MKRSKLIIGFLTLAVGALIGSSNVVGAMGATQMAPNPPATKADCKNGGWQHHTDENGKPFSNQGQCVAWVNAHGYGGGHGSINIGIGTVINGNNNVVTNVINFLFGHNTNGANVNVGVTTNVHGNNNVVANIINLIFAHGSQPGNVNVAAHTNIQGSNNFVSNFIRFVFA